MVSRHVMMAVVFGLGLVACGGGSQSALDPSASGQALQSGTGNASVHKATSGYVWRSTIMDIDPGKISSRIQFCDRGATALNGGFRSRGIGPNVIVLDSHPDSAATGWVIRAKNTGSTKEALEDFLLCTA